MSNASERADLVDELREGIAEAERQTVQVRELTDPLNESQFRWCPDEESWCVGRCLTHLAISTRTFLKDVGPALEKARDGGWVSQGPYRYGWFGRLFCWIMEPPPKFRVKTFDNLVPAADDTKEVVVEDFATAQEELIRSMRAANGIDLGRAKVPSPMSSRLKWSVGQVFRIALAHNRRHLWQSRQVIDHTAFPPA